MGDHKFICRRCDTFITIPLMVFIAELIPEDRICNQCLWVSVVTDPAVRQSMATDLYGGEVNPRSLDKWGKRY